MVELTMNYGIMFKINRFFLQYIFKHMSLSYLNLKKKSMYTRLFFIQLFNLLFPVLLEKGEKQEKPLLRGADHVALLQPGYRCKTTLAKRGISL